MSYLLKTVLDELEGGGMVTTDDDLVIETLDELGISIRHDVVISANEIGILRNSIVALQVLAISNADEFLENLASKSMEVLEGF